MQKPRRLSRKTIYTSRWVNLYVDRVELPTGAFVEQQHVVDFNCDAVGCLVENEQGEILFVHAYRYVTDSIEWEIPEGRIDDGEDPIAAGRREVLEETGFESHDHEIIYKTFPVNGISPHAFYIVKCHAGQDTGVFDRNEVRAIRWMSREEVKRMIQNREMHDGFALIALLLWLESDRSEAAF